VQQQPSGLNASPVGASYGFRFIARPYRAGRDLFLDLITHISPLKGLLQWHLSHLNLSNV
jgi:hypothetical protein